MGGIELKVRRKETLKVTESIIRGSSKNFWEYHTTETLVRVPLIDLCERCIRKTIDPLGTHLSRS